jgi:hypothetical protein
MRYAVESLNRRAKNRTGRGGGGGGGGGGGTGGAIGIWAANWNRLEQE